MRKIEIVCDNTELFSLWKPEVPDVVVIGGYALDHVKMNSFLQDIRKIKSKYTGSEWTPVKWNIKDLNRALAKHSLTDKLVAIQKNSESIRTELLDLLVDYNSSVFLSVVMAYSSRKQVLGRTKEDVVGFSFSNLLMRVGLFKQEINEISECELVLDWPDRNSSNPFINEYMAGWKYGVSQTTNSQVKYQCGTLQSLGFRPAPVFTVTDLDERLQVADLVVGAARSFLDLSMGKASINKYGIEKFKNLIPLLYKDNNGRQFGRGLSVAPARSKFSGIIYKAFKDLL